MKRVKPGEKKPPCSVDRCGTPRIARGWCSKHYQRWLLRGGNPSKKLKSGRRPGTIQGQDNPNWRGGKASHPLIHIYRDMVARCHSPRHTRYQDYGGRGIRVCERWRDDFWAFVEDVGPRPEGKTKGGKAYWQLDRVDNDGDYEPGNVRWATPTQQIENRRTPDYSRVLRGSQQTLHKLKEDEVLNIVRRASTGKRGIQRRLAEEYGVTASTINRIMKGQLWAWLTKINQ